MKWNANWKTPNWLGVSLVGMLAGLAATRGAADETSKGIPPVLQLDAPYAVPTGNVIPSDDVQFFMELDDEQIASAIDEAARSEFWIGVQLSDLPELVKSQLNLEHGLATLAVMADSPALKAGVQTHDILLKANDKPLREPVDLVRVVNEVKEQPMKLTLLRHGKEQTIEVTPAKRPKQDDEQAKLARVAIVQEGDNNPELAQLERALQALQTAAPGEDRVGMWFVRPPILANDKIRMLIKAAELPENVTVTITKSGSQPARIVVKRAEQKWETTEDKLDTLPEELRPVIARFLGKGHELAIQSPMWRMAKPQAGIAVPLAPAAVVAPSQHVERRVIVTHGDGGDTTVSGKLDTILEKLKSLETKLEKLQGKN